MKLETSFRLNVSKQLPEEGFQKDLYTGVIDTKKVEIITAIQRIVEHVFMDALAHPSSDKEDDCPMIKNLLLPGLRSFCSALKGNNRIIDNCKLYFKNSYSMRTGGSGGTCIR